MYEQENTCSKRSVCRHLNIHLIVLVEHTEIANHQDQLVKEKVATEVRAVPEEGRGGERGGEGRGERRGGEGGSCEKRGEVQRNIGGTEG